MRHAILAATAAALTCLPVARAAPPASSVTVDIDTATGHIVMPARVAGEGPYWFILDTGNRQTVIYDRLARKLGLETRPYGTMTGAGTGSVEVRQTCDLAITVTDRNDPEQTDTITEPVVTVLPDDASLRDFNGKRVEGFLGTTLIERHLVSIDYARNTLTLRPRDGYTPPEGATVLEMKIAADFPYFEGRVVPLLHGHAIEPIEGNFLLDLGATHGVQLLPKVSRPVGLLDAHDPAIRVIGRGSGIDVVPFEILRGPAGEITMGGASLDDGRIDMIAVDGGGPPIENLVGAVGSGSFRGRTVTLDYSGGRLIIEPGAP